MNEENIKGEVETAKFYPSDFTAEQFLERLNYLTYPDKRYIRKNVASMLIVSVMNMYAKQELDKQSTNLQKLIEERIKELVERMVKLKGATENKEEAEIWMGLAAGGINELTTLLSSLKTFK